MPRSRPRRNRINKTLRDLVAETNVTNDDLICPLFVTNDSTREITAMPGINRWNLHEIGDHVEKLVENGINSFIIFGIPDKRDNRGSEAWKDTGIVQMALKQLTDNFPKTILFSDVCLCQYTSHGHCGVISEDGIVENDPTLELLARVSLSHAKAGVSCVAPSDMMDGRVQAIRLKLDEEGYTNVGIMAYSAKYKSNFYGPFREAADSSPKFGDRSTYQMDFRNSKEALRELELDYKEGADILMVKPALAYLDIIKAAAANFNVPIAAYNVSGEYSMVKAAAAKDWINERLVALEILTSIKRAGADLILTYFAEDFSNIILEV